MDHTKTLLGRIRSVALMSVAVAGIAGCTKIDTPTVMTTEKIQIERQNFSERFVTADVNDVVLDRLADHFGRYGEGEAEIIVSYDPRSRKNTAMKASDQLHRIAQGLQKRGVTQLKSSVLAAENSGDVSEMMIGYTSLSALPPQDCTMMPGYESYDTEIDMDYKLGCSVDSLVARQVTRPGDLEGRSYGHQDGDGRRAAEVVEPYRSGEGYGDLGGYSVSD